MPLIVIWVEEQAAQNAYNFQWSSVSVDMRSFEEFPTMSHSRVLKCGLSMNTQQTQQQYRILRIIPVTLAIARATSIIRQYPRSFIHFAHSPARSLCSLTGFLPVSLSLIILLSSIELRLAEITSRLYYCSATPRLFSSTHKVFPNSPKFMVFDVYLDFNNVSNFIVKTKPIGM